MNDYEIAAKFLEETDGHKYRVSGGKVEEHPDIDFVCWRCDEKIFDEYISVANVDTPSGATTYFHTRCLHEEMKQKARAAKISGASEEN